jgi:two-component system response regulator VanR
VKDKILVIEDDLDIRELISEFLTAAGYCVETAGDGLDGLEKFNKEQFNLIMLDVMLPKIDGFVICEIIRKTSNMPIIMLTALEGEEEQIKGFDLRVDDYITKPFSMNILIRRVEAVLRRGRVLEEVSVEKDNTIVKFEEIMLDSSKFKVWVNRDEIELTSKEFEILEILIKNKERVLKREVLLNTLWGYDFYGDARVIDTHIKNLRQKLKVDYIKTIRGVGYKIEK